MSEKDAIPVSYDQLLRFAEACNGRCAELEIRIEALERKVDRHLLNRSIDTLELNYRAWNCLRNANIGTIGELIQLTEHDLLEIKNLGRRTLKDIIEELYRVGLALARRP